MGLPKKRENIFMNMEYRNLGSVFKELGTFQILLPKFQRGYEWKKEDIENLIKSLCEGIPIPPIYLHRKKNSEIQYEIIDGQQRLLGLYLYYNDLFFSEKNTSEKNYLRLTDISLKKTINYLNEIEKMIEKYNITEIDKLYAIKIMNDINLRGEIEKTSFFLDGEEITFSKLSVSDQFKFLSLSLPIVYITSDDEFSARIFKMLNSTSKRLKAQQIRDGENWSLFEKFYLKIKYLEYIRPSKLDYVIVEEVFDIISTNNLELKNEITGNKKERLDKLSKIALSKDGVKTQILNDLNCLIKNKEVDIILDNIGANNELRKLVALLILKVKDIDEIKILISDLNNFYKNEEYKKLKKYKVHYGEILEYFLREKRYGNLF